MEPDQLYDGCCAEIQFFLMGKHKPYFSVAANANCCRFLLRRVDRY
jgi:hypothetical protein